MTEEELADLIEKWHNDPNSFSLHEFLGWTVQEYTHWLETGELPLTLVDTSRVHLNHCYQGEYADSCKYGDENCPAKRFLKRGMNMDIHDEMVKENHCPICSEDGKMRKKCVDVTHRGILYQNEPQVECTACGNTFWSSAQIQRWEDDK
jgi:hypothetical protein